MLKAQFSNGSAFQDFNKLVETYFEQTNENLKKVMDSIGGELELFTKLCVNPDFGLESLIVPEKRRLYGPNTYHEKLLKSPRDYLPKRLSILWKILMLYSVVLCIIYSVVQPYRVPECVGIIFALIFFEGFKCLHRLSEEDQMNIHNQKSMSIKAPVIRDRGTSVLLKSEELVVGDMILLQEGMLVPADVFLIEAVDLSTNEFPLTGRARKVKHASFDQVSENEGLSNHSTAIPGGVFVESGSGRAVVLLVGSNSYRGKLGNKMPVEVTSTNAQLKLTQFSEKISKHGIGFGVSIFLLLVIWFLIQRQFTNTFNSSTAWMSLFDDILVLLTCLYVTFSTDFTLIWNVVTSTALNKMHKEGIFVKNSKAIDRLPTVDTVCLNMTNILDDSCIIEAFINQTAHQIVDGFEMKDIFQTVETHDLLNEAFSCNSHSQGYLESFANFDEMLKDLICKMNKNSKKIHKMLAILGNLGTYDSSRRMMCTTITVDETDHRTYIKGSGSEIISKCSYIYCLEERKIIELTMPLREKLKADLENLRKLQKDSVGFAFKGHFSSLNLDYPDKFVYIGSFIIQLYSKYDHKPFITQMKEASIEPKLLTNASLSTAKQISKKVGIYDRDESIVLHGNNFFTSASFTLEPSNNSADPGILKFMNQIKAKRETFEKLHANADILAEAKPEHKYAFLVGLNTMEINSLFVGSQVSDLLPLMHSDLGITYKDSVQILKYYSSVILKERTVREISRLVSWGRSCRMRIQRFLQFYITGLISLAMINLLSTLLLEEVVITPIQILFYYGVVLMFLIPFASDTPNPECMKVPPAKQNDSFIETDHKTYIVSQVIYQFIILTIMLFSLNEWMPESLPTVTLNDVPIYTNQYGYMRSGHAYQIFSASPDYSELRPVYGVSRQYTMIFATFILMQVFSALNCREGNFKVNTFFGIGTNKSFLWIPLLVLLELAIGVSFFGDGLDVSPNGLGSIQWIVCYSFGLGCCLWSYLFGRACSQI